MPENHPASTPRPRRARATRRSVVLIDRLARFCITLGGVGTIVAVSLVCVFLVWVVLPLFRAPSSHLASEVELPGSGARVIRVGVDEYKNLGWRLFEDGRLLTCQIRTGKTLQEIELFSGRPPLAWSFSSGDGIELAASFADVTVQIGRISFLTTFLDGGDVPPEVRALTSGESRPHGDAVYEATSEGQVSRQQLLVRFDDPVRVVESEPLVLVDQRHGRF